MRYITFFFFFSISVFAQTNNISVVSAEKLNVVYRGVPNPIKIAVPGAKSFTATAPGLVADTLRAGNYIFRPGAGNEVIVKIEAVMDDGCVLKEEKIFRILNLPPLLGQIEGREGDCEVLFMKIEEISSIAIKVNWEDFLFLKAPESSTVKRFRISFHNEEGQELNNEGSKISKENILQISKLKKGDLVFIHHIVYLEDTTHITNKSARPIIIELVD